MTLLKIPLCKIVAFGKKYPFQGGNIWSDLCSAQESPTLYTRSLDSMWLAKGMAFTSPESDLDSSLDGQLISSA